MYKFNPLINLLLQWQIFTAVKVEALWCCIVTLRCDVAFWRRRFIIALLNTLVHRFNLRQVWGLKIGKERIFPAL